MKHKKQIIKYERFDWFTFFSGLFFTLTGSFGIVRMIMIRDDSLWNILPLISSFSICCIGIRILLINEKVVVQKEVIIKDVKKN